MKFNHLSLLAALALASCTNTAPYPEMPPVVVPGEGNTPDYDPTETPAFSYEIASYSGLTATDTPEYPVGNSDLNPDENDWEATVTVTYADETATVTGNSEAVGVMVNGANVDLNLGTTKFIKVIATGTSANGSLRLSGDRKHMLVLDNLTLTSTDRPAINDQNKKRVFLCLEGKSAIADGPNYVNSVEDRKGAFFSEGHVVLCGSGVLEVEGKYRHGFATDGFLYVNPGATLVVTDAAKNAIHVKGSGLKNEYRGIEVTGGYVYANTSAPAGKAMKCDTEIRLRGGRIDLNCSGNPAFDTTDNTLSSAACIKCDAEVIISGGTVNLTATGSGAKGINSDTNVSISGGTITAALSGDGVQDQGDTSTPKGIVAHGSLAISGGGIYVSAIGLNASALESDNAVNIDGGVTYTFGRAYGLKTPDANATKGVVLCGGERNSAMTGGHAYSYDAVGADEVTRLTNNGQLVGTFRWPVALAPASLLTNLF